MDSEGNKVGSDNSTVYKKWSVSVLIHSILIFQKYPYGQKSAFLFYGLLCRAGLNAHQRGNDAFRPAVKAVGVHVVQQPRAV